MASSDSDGPPPLAGSDSDSDGPPPLVDSSSDQEEQTAAPSSGNETSSDSGGEEVNWFEQIAARARGDRTTGAQMPPWFRDYLNDSHLRNNFQQQMLQDSQQRERIALQDRERNAYKANYSQLMRMKKDAVSERDLEQKCQLLLDASEVAQELMDSPHSEAQRQPVETTAAEIQSMLAEATLDRGKYKECIKHAKKAEEVLRRCLEQRRGNVVVLKRKLAACLVHRGRAHLASNESAEARACAEEAKKSGATDLGELSSLLDDEDAESDEDLPQISNSEQGARWVCPTCDEPNRSDRKTCNMCNATRSMTDTSVTPADKQQGLHTPTAQSSRSSTDNHSQPSVVEQLPKASKAKAAPKAMSFAQPQMNGQQQNGAGSGMVMVCMVPVVQAPPPPPEPAVSRCRKCNQDIPGGKKAAKRHAKDECPKRQVECPDCGDRMSGAAFETHPQHCGMRMVTCTLCQDEMTADDLPHHMAHECLNRPAKCEFCDWTGMGMYMEEHLDTCPMREEFCIHCFEAMPQWQMVSHVCSFPEQEECDCCMDSLGAKGPMILLREREEDGRFVRSCPHVSLCQICAGVWKEKSPNKDCPQCRTPFTTAAPLTDWLRDFYFPVPADVEQPAPVKAPPLTLASVPESKHVSPKAKTKAKAKQPPPDLPGAPARANRWTTESAGAAASVAAPLSPPPPIPKAQPTGYPSHQATPSQSLPCVAPKAEATAKTAATTLQPRSRGQLRRMPLPKPSDTRDWQTCMVSPLDIQFTHDNINEKFTKFQRNGKWVEPTLLDTVRECLKTDIPSQVERIDVIWHEQKLYVAGTYNRRLCVWRLLSILFPERFRQVKVRFHPQRDKERVFRHSDGKTKLSTKCQGEWVQIRWGKFVGKQVDTDPRWWSSNDDSCLLDPGVQWEDARKLLKSALR